MSVLQIHDVAACMLELFKWLYSFLSYSGRLSIYQRESMHFIKLICTCVMLHMISDMIKHIDKNVWSRWIRSPMLMFAIDFSPHFIPTNSETYSIQVQAPGSIDKSTKQILRQISQHNRSLIFT